MLRDCVYSATPIHRGGGGPGFKKNNAPAPAHPPPNGYICYRCGEKGNLTLTFLFSYQDTNE